LVIESAEFFNYKKEVSKTIELQYSDVRYIDYECLEFEVTVVEKVFDITVLYKIKADVKSMENFLEKTQRVIKTL